MFTGLDYRRFFEGQLVHIIALMILLVVLYLFSSSSGFLNGSFLGLSSGVWAILVVADAVLHQVYVWLCWRLELDENRLSKRFGINAFRYYQVGFTVLFVARPILAFAVGFANRGTLPIDPMLGYLIALLLFLPAAYLVYSIRTYFGFKRAYGIDHFDGSYRAIPMYVFGFLMLWVPAFLFQSIGALGLAAFSHLYIWVHFFCTEKPDMKRIYGDPS